MTTDQQTHHHDVIAPVRYTYNRDDATTATVYGVICYALEPWHDPSAEAVEVTVPDGATWATCPDCRETFRVDQ